MCGGPDVADRRSALLDWLALLIWPYVRELLTLDSWSTSGLFNSPTANSDTPGRLVLVVAGIKSTTAGGLLSQEALDRL